MDKVWHIRDPDEVSSRGTNVVDESRTDIQKRNPAISFSISLFFWGAGQYYNRNWDLGSLLSLLMFNLWTLIGVAVYFQNDYHLLFTRYISFAHLIFLGWIFLVFTFVIGFAGAAQAYRETDSGRQTPFTGVEKRWLPPVCSFFVPGWGQFLNGQFWKGVLFMLASVLLFTAIPSVILLYVLWPTIGQSPLVPVLELDFIVSLVILPFLALIWLISVYDALRVSLDEVKKESWLKRFSYARNRLRLKGWGDTVFKRLRLTVPLLALLAIVAYAGSHYFPTESYREYARVVSSTLSERGMAVISRLVEDVLEEHS